MATNTHTAIPVSKVIMLCISASVDVPNAENIAVSSVSIETAAAARLIARDAESTGLSNFLYLTTLIIAKVIEVKVYAASAIVVI